LVVTGPSGIGKSTLSARLAGTIPGAVLLDADIHASDLISVVPPNKDYPAFWRSMMRLAHEVAQNNVVVVYFSVMLPEQILSNGDVLSYFDAAHFLCLTCPPEVLRARIAATDGSSVAGARIDVWLDFNSALVAAARQTATATVLNAGGPASQAEADFRQWITAQLHPCSPSRRTQHREQRQAMRPAYAGWPNRTRPGGPGRWICAAVLSRLILDRVKVRRAS
jgi:hypothetical protein